MTYNCLNDKYIFSISKGIDDGFWLGGTREGRPDYEWLTNSCDFPSAYWQNGQPDYGGDTVLLFTTRWSDPPTFHDVRATWTEMSFCAFAIWNSNFMLFAEKYLRMLSVKCLKQAFWSPNWKLYLCFEWISVKFQLCSFVFI